MVEQMWEWLPGQRDAQVGHMGKVGLCTLAGMVDLRKHDLLFRATLGAPEGNPSLEGTQLAWLIASGMLVAQQCKQRLGLDGAIAFEVGLHPRPIVGERVGTCAIRTGLLDLARELART